MNRNSDTRTSISCICYSECHFLSFNFWCWLGCWSTSKFNFVGPWDSISGVIFCHSISDLNLYWIRVVLSLYICVCWPLGFDAMKNKLIIENVGVDLNLLLMIIYCFKSINCNLSILLIVFLVVNDVKGGNNNFFFFFCDDGWKE